MRWNGFKELGMFSNGFSRFTYRVVVEAGRGDGNCFIFLPVQLTWIPLLESGLQFAFVAHRLESCCKISSEHSHFFGQTDRTISRGSSLARFWQFTWSEERKTIAKSKSARFIFRLRNKRWNPSDRYIHSSFRWTGRDRLFRWVSTWAPRDLAMTLWG
jgi:hypothetical protein